ncbi:MAG TPA: bifunctional phosphoribosylaminoimidazolecarboxamide formyltransferase/IMP cyclohydrolase [Bacteroidia bacterium]|nr:bifunctional phosphoribosylaminoimidazolecarboxamide formyltransferase/IMP cyclohydrolase [Bacteroidia bacterium]
MSRPVKIKNALISVFYKDNLEPVIRRLHELGVGLFSTGGTQTFIEQLGIPVTPVEQLTSYPSILGGRVKTLHPKVFGGILGRRGLDTDVAQLEEYEIPEIDLVIVDLYPFGETVASGASEQDIIEKIDIGGISLIRAAAKNFSDVLIVASRQDYPGLLDILNSSNGSTEVEDRRRFAARAFAVSSEYDTTIFNWFNSDGAELAFRSAWNGGRTLRYGENPHQSAKFFGDLSQMFDQLCGKELSYNNLLDIDAAVNLMADFTDTTFAILKHNNACGLASRKTVLQAWTDALAGDPVSAFGGILICNRIIDAKAAEEITKIFFEVIIAPGYEPAALETLRQKQNRIVLVQKPVTLPSGQFRSLLNGVIAQEKDLRSETAADMKPVTHSVPTEDEYADLVFANKLVKHTKSNTIVLVKNRQLLASGTGQTSRVDALKQAIAKTQQFGFSLDGAVMASDAFFPFADCVEIANGVGIHAVVQPGGSIRDKDSVEFCDRNGMAMVFTGTRHFKH